MTEWYLIATLAMTGQHVAVPVQTEELCRQFLADIARGVPVTITTKNGLVLPIARGITCQRETEEERSERDQARKAGV
jgi:hypothetical protein